VCRVTVIVWSVVIIFLLDVLRPRSLDGLRRGRRRGCS
jgi:hypothetical protein